MCVWGGVRRLSSLACVLRHSFPVLNPLHPSLPPSLPPSLRQDLQGICLMLLIFRTLQLNSLKVGQAGATALKALHVLRVHTFHTSCMQCLHPAGTARIHTSTPPFLQVACILLGPLTFTLPHLHSCRLRASCCR